MTDFRGIFVWYELLSPDPDAASAFYGEVVGWTARDSGMPGMDYRFLSMGDTGIAGLMAPPAGMQPGWIGYVAVDDVDQGAAENERLGGMTLQAPMDIPNVGRRAIIADPQGARIALFKSVSETASPRPAPGSPGLVAWNELLAADWETAFPVYETLFGWTKQAPIDMGPMGIYQLFGKGELGIGGMMTKPPAAPAPTWLYYIAVEAIDPALSRVTAAGGQILVGPQQVPGGSWIVNALDPQGIAFALVAPAR
jgi:predicted enzyme related to lactoylglutathione lyase